jgi:hypothetical protein
MYKQVKIDKDTIDIWHFTFHHKRKIGKNHLGKCFCIGFQPHREGYSEPELVFREAVALPNECTAIK